MGRAVRRVRPGRAPPDDADLVWIEIPGNPLLSVPDLEAAAAHPAPVVCDTTAATPVLCRPLEHGVDVVLHCVTKYLGGHHDVLLGALVFAEPASTIASRRLRMQTGAIASPDSAWLLLRSLKTLELRVQRQSTTALELARRLAAHPRVELVRYPGLGPDPRAARYLHGGFGGLLSFDVAERTRPGGSKSATRLITNATSLGGVDTTIEGRLPLGGRPRSAGPAPAQRRRSRTSKRSGLTSSRRSSGLTGTSSRAKSRRDSNPRPAHYKCSCSTS